MTTTADVISVAMSRQDGARAAAAPEWTLVKVNYGCSGKVWSAYLKKVAG